MKKKKVLKKEQPVLEVEVNDDGLIGMGFRIEVVRYWAHLKIAEIRDGVKMICDSKEIINGISGTAPWVLVLLCKRFLKLGKVVALQMSFGVK